MYTHTYTYIHVLFILGGGLRPPKFPTPPVRLSIPSCPSVPGSEGEAPLPARPTAKLDQKPYKNAGHRLLTGGEGDTGLCRALKRAI